MRVIRAVGTLCVGVLLAACASTSTHFSSTEQLNASVDQAVEDLYRHSSAGKQLAQRASGMLVFPEVYKGGFIFGAEYGEGALLVNGRVVDYYNITGGSFGLQAGGQVKTQVILFMNDDVLNRFRSRAGWEAGVDGSVAIATLGAGGELSTETMREPIIGFVFSNKGLMANLTLEGAKITRIQM